MPSFKHFCVIFVVDGVISLFKVPPKCSAQVLSNVPKCMKAVRHLKQKYCKAHSGVSCSAVVHKFSVTESTIYIK